MGDLIRALTILAKYTDTQFPTHCEHDVMYVAVDPKCVSDADIKALGRLGFDVSDGAMFQSTLFGSC